MKRLFFDDLEKSYARLYFKRNIRLLIITMIVLVLMMSESLLPGQIVFFITNAFVGLDYSVQNFYLFAICVCIMAFLLPLYQFNFMMKRSSSDVYMSLPIKKERFFYVQFMLGVGILIVTTSICFILTGTLVTARFSYLAMFLIIEVLGVFLYTFYTWLCVKCNTLLDAIVIMIAYSIVPLFIHAALQTFNMQITDKVFYSSVEYGYSQMSDLIWSLIGFLSIPWLMRSLLQLFANDGVNYMTITHISFIIACIAWFFLCVLLYRLAKKAYVTRKSEESEYRTKSSFAYPLLIPLITSCFLLMCGITESSIIWIAFIFVVFLCMQFFTMRKIHITWKIIIQFASIILVIWGLQTALIKTNAFGLLEEVPKLADVRSVSISYVEPLDVDTGGVVYVNYESYLIDDQNKIKEILKEHEAIMTYSKKGANRSFSHINYSSENVSRVVNITYELANNEWITRYYRYEATQFQEHVKSYVDEWIADGLLIKENNRNGFEG